jgi:hypothetical protein
LATRAAPGEARVVVVPSVANELGAGSVWQVDQARLAGVPVFAFDRTRSRIASKFLVEPIENGTQRINASIVFAETP